MSRKLRGFKYKGFKIAHQAYLVSIAVEDIFLSVGRKFVHFQNAVFSNPCQLFRRDLGQETTYSRTRPRTQASQGERGDVPGWVLVVLMTAGLVTGIWTIAAPRLNQILRNSLDSMNSIR